MPQLSGWHIMLAIIATGIGVGVYYDPVHIVPLMIWTFMGAAIAVGVEKLLGR